MNFFLSLLVLLSLSAAKVQAQQGPIYNPRSGQYYTSIQTALDEAAVGDTLRVSPGTYNESLQIGTPLTLQGVRQGEQGPVLVPPPGTPAAVINGFTSGFETVMDGFEVRVVNPPYAILVNSAKATLSNNIIIGDGRGTAVATLSPVGLTVKMNTLREFPRGISSENGPDGPLSGALISANRFENVLEAIFLANCPTATIERNTIGNVKDPIRFQTSTAVTLNSSPSARVNDNTVCNYHLGVYVLNGDGTVIQSNSFNEDMDTAGAGVYITGSSGVRILSNKIVNIEYSMAFFYATNTVAQQNWMDHSEYGMETSQLEPQYAIDARQNWWGASDGPSVGGSGTGVPVGPNILFDPWLTSAPAFQDRTCASVTPPAAPRNLAATAISRSQINLTWTAGSRDEDGFKIERSLDGAAFAQVATTGPGVLSYADTGLAASTLYYYRVRAYNRGGDSAYSNIASATTMAPPPPAAPTNLVATAVSSSQINLTWTAGSRDEDGFNIERSPDGTTFTPVATVGAGVTSYANTGLAPLTRYYYRVRAYNRGGPSGYSNTANATTLAISPPAAPSNLTATAVSSSQINLTWTAGSRDEDGFKIERSRDGTTFTQIATVGVGVTNYSNTGLTPSTRYFYRVRAYNRGGDSGYSNTANATTLPLPPAAPSNLTATAISTMAINLAWQSNSTNEDGFKIERSPDGVAFAQIATVGARITAYSDTGLIPATVYYYRVRAYNAGGDSAYSNIASAMTTPPPPPAAPTNLTARAISRSEIDLTWQSNSTNEDGFKIERSLDGVTFIQINIVGPGVTIYADTGLARNRTYYYRVRAFNAAGGDSDYSNVASARTRGGSD